MKLAAIISKLSVIRIEGDTEREISSVTFDSRKLVDGCLFVAMSGTASDGHAYISQSVESVAKAIVCEK